jgi:hypothetical protein
MDSTKYVLHPSCYFCYRATSIENRKRTTNGWWTLYHKYVHTTGEIIPCCDTCLEITKKYPERVDKLIYARTMFLTARSKFWGLS